MIQPVLLSRCFTSRLSGQVHLCSQSIVVKFISATKASLDRNAAKAHPFQGFINQQSFHGAISNRGSLVDCSSLPSHLIAQLHQPVLPLSCFTSRLSGSRLSGSRLSGSLAYLPSQARAPFYQQALPLSCFTSRLSGQLLISAVESSLDCNAVNAFSCHCAQANVAPWLTQHNQICCRGVFAQQNCHRDHCPYHSKGRISHFGSSGTIKSAAESSITHGPCSGSLEVKTFNTTAASGPHFQSSTWQAPHIYRDCYTSTTVQPGTDSNTSLPAQTNDSAQSNQLLPESNSKCGPSQPFPTIKAA
ncbi:hypothetical protein EJ05DRAFT_392271 [Pseudovirgaria hyperparasitica]|uniref:Uncharacterized protein n=1 Tax=Pseudovirgaria hyperparasitica TaxID=470096 RepID=A0A6A6W6H4_9PEZI|nr:uncharacterized protein EJ05DRAFT_392271 [Pseudovirgaria hyperparasitica]KAF2757506.1 hypothetical protein EJ05DRAFT_392271 [Pseudovirgaria hyperparasitica]